MNKDTVIAAICLLEEDNNEEGVSWFKTYKCSVEGEEVELEHVHTEGGGEGDGEEYWVVIKARLLKNPNEETLWKIPGFYQSYAGGELDIYDTYQVKPVEKTYIDYVKI